MNTMNALMTVTFFAPMALMLATNLLTARTDGPSVAAARSRRLSVTPLPTNRAPAPANEQRYLEAA
jgi:hypothetical protein